MTKKISITAVILAKDEAEMIANCIDTLEWCSEILVIDNGSTDLTAQIAQDLGARVVSFTSDSFAQLRNKALKHVKTDWIFYIDPDERVTPQLSQEILVNIETQTGSVFSFNRQNICYGQLLEHGGWNTDVVTRLFKTEFLDSWYGDIHESPKFSGQVISLHSPLIHLTHRSVVAGLEKSINWTPIEARLLAESDLPKVGPKTFLRKGIMEFVRRLVFKKGYKDGVAGWVEALTQGINRMLIYMQVWELQQDPDIDQKYQMLEESIAKEWQKFSKKQDKK